MQEVNPYHQAWANTADSKSPRLQLVPWEGLAEFRLEHGTVDAYEFQKGQNAVAPNLLARNAATGFVPSFHCLPCDTTITDNAFQVFTHCHSKKHRDLCICYGKPDLDEKNQSGTSHQRGGPSQSSRPGYESEMPLRARLEEEEEPCIGLSHIVEFMDASGSRAPLYSCKECNFAGNPQSARSHIISDAHRRKSLISRYPVLEKMITLMDKIEIMERAKEEEDKKGGRDGRRYEDIEVVMDDEQYNQIRGDLYPDEPAQPMGQPKFARGFSQEDDFESGGPGPGFPTGSYEREEPAGRPWENSNEQEFGRGRGGFFGRGGMRRGFGADQPPVTQPFGRGISGLDQPPPSFGRGGGRGFAGNHPHSGPPPTFGRGRGRGFDPGRPGPPPPSSSQGRGFPPDEPRSFATGRGGGAGRGFIPEPVGLVSGVRGGGGGSLRGFGPDTPGHQPFGRGRGRGFGPEQPAFGRGAKMGPGFGRGGASVGMDNYNQGEDENAHGPSHQPMRGRGGAQRGFGPPWTRGPPPSGPSPLTQYPLGSERSFSTPPPHPSERLPPPARADGARIPFPPPERGPPPPLPPPPQAQPPRPEFSHPPPLVGGYGDGRHEKLDRESSYWERSPDSEYDRHSFPPVEPRGDTYLDTKPPPYRMSRREDDPYYDYHAERNMHMDRIREVRRVDADFGRDYIMENTMRRPPMRYYGPEVDEKEERRRRKEFRSRYDFFDQDNDDKPYEGPTIFDKVYRKHKKTESSSARSSEDRGRSKSPPASYRRSEKKSKRSKRKRSPNSDLEEGEEKGIDEEELLRVKKKTEAKIRREREKLERYEKRIRELSGATENAGGAGPSRLTSSPMTKLVIREDAEASPPPPGSELRPVLTPEGDGEYESENEYDIRYSEFITRTESKASSQSGEPAQAASRGASVGGQDSPDHDSEIYQNIYDPY